MKITFYFGFWITMQRQKTEQKKSKIMNWDRMMGTVSERKYDKEERFQGLYIDDGLSMNNSNL